MEILVDLFLALSFCFIARWCRGPDEEALRDWRKMGDEQLKIEDSRSKWTARMKKKKLIKLTMITTMMKILFERSKQN